MAAERGAARTTPAINAAVLAGGRSSRLGFDKALLRIGDQPLVHWLPARLQPAFATVAVITDRSDRYAIPWPQLVDRVPGAGPLGGIAAGLESLAGPALFVCACDMPLLNVALVQRLCAAVHGYDLVIPEREGRLEPLCAVYTPACLPPIRRLLAAGRLRAAGVAATVQTRVLAEGEWRDLDPAGDSFLSINTPVDVRHVRERAAHYGLLLQLPVDPDAQDR